MPILTAPISVELLHVSGDDLTVVDAARVSFAKQSARLPDGSLSPADAKLIRYLVRHGHWTTWAHCSARFRIKAPIFVARQLVKHQVGLVWNEVSRRYVDGLPEYWMPDVLHARPDGSIKQGAGAVSPASTANRISLLLLCERADEVYRDMINDGIAPEEARMCLPLNTMTEWWWTGSIAAFARVCGLRLDPHAQEATREAAAKIDDLLQPHFPVTWAELRKGWLDQPADPRG